MTQVTREVQFYRDEVEYRLDDGYTLDGGPRGPTRFKVRCQANAEFSRTQEPKPVRCGRAPRRDYAFTGYAEYSPART